MAIGIVEYSMIRSLRVQGALPVGGNLLEIGQANWFGNVELNQLAEDIAEFAPGHRREALASKLRDISDDGPPKHMFALAKMFWETFLQPASMTAIDLGGDEQAHKLDLNQPVDLGSQFDVVSNLGTAEHVFNVAQLFKTIHEHTLPNGLMIHVMPFTGWIDHGFFNFHPTFYWDLAAANRYAVMLTVYGELRPPKMLHVPNREAIPAMLQKGEIGPNSLLYVVLKKNAEETEFAVPMQGYYADTLSKESADNWNKLV